MAFSWIERLMMFFEPREPDAPAKAETEVKEAPVEIKPPVKEKTEFEKIIDQFNFRTDMIVISLKNYNELKQGEQDWLDSLGNKVHYFNGDSLVNIAIVRTM
jgi:hypothetical protein